MSKLTDIEQKIDQMEGGAFQVLCDIYFSKLGFSYFQALGKKEGTSKTTKGIPDTIFKTEDGRYIFSMYTTQKENIFSKAKKDILDCLNKEKTGIETTQLAEILYCHTSSNMDAGEDKQLTDLCERHGVALKIFGINKIAMDIYLHYHKVALDVLGVALDTNQVFSLPDFISTYNANKMAAPVDTNFLFREEELKEIEEAIEQKDVIILCGKAGVGKTRFALHFAERYSEVHKGNVYCIRSNGQLIYDDLRDVLSMAGNYVFIIDDANLLTGLQHAIRQMTTLGDGYQVKVIVTVRDYAKSKVVQDIREVSTFKTITVGKLTDKEISEMLHKNLKIYNQHYVERIVRIAEGNARIAMIAGKIASDSNRLDSIRDASDLYESYYGRYLHDQSADADMQLLQSAGILAFLDSINLEQLEPLTPVLNYCRLDRATFISLVRRLYEQEMVDIYNDKAAKFSDQCLANYLLKHVFVDKKLIPFAVMLESCFFTYQQRTIRSVGTLLNVYASEDMGKYIANEICVVWDNIKNKALSNFWDFVEVFFSFKPTETLLLLKEKIDQQSSVSFDLSKIAYQDIEKKTYVHDEILKVLGNFSKLDHLPTAIDLFFLYFSKRPDLFLQFCHTAISDWGIDHTSNQNGFDTQIQLCRKLKEKVETQYDNNIDILGVYIARGLLKLTFEAIQEGRGHTAIIHSIRLKASEDIKSYRKLLWETILILSKKSNVKHLVRDTLSAYSQECCEAPDQELVDFDIRYIQQCIVENFSPEILSNCVALAHIVARLKEWGWNFSECFFEFMYHDNMKIYQLLMYEDEEPDPANEANERISRDQIVEFAEHCSFDDIAKVIYVLNECRNDEFSEGWLLSKNLTLLFKALVNRKELFIDSIRSYLAHGTPLSIYPNELVCLLFSIGLSDNEIYNLICTADGPGKNVWLFAYFYEIPSELIRKKHVRLLYSFLNKDDGFITSSSYRKLDFLDKYLRIDKDVFIKASKILLSKKEKSPSTFQIYFKLLFVKYSVTPQFIINKFDGHYDLLTEIYMSLWHSDPHIDYDGEFFLYIYSVYPQILELYIHAMMIYRQRHHRSQKQPIMRLWLHKSYIDIMDSITSYIVKNTNSRYQFYLRYYYQDFLQQIENDPLIEMRQLEWIMHYIDLFSSDSIAMYGLFAAISVYPTSRRCECILHLIKTNKDPAIFCAIPLTEMEESFWGSIIPYYERKVAFLKSLLPFLCGLEYLEHNRIVSEQILYWENQIKVEEVREILSDM